MEEYILDRVEGDLAVIEVTGQDETIHHIQISRLELPANVQDGDVLLCTEHGWQVDADATAQRRIQMEQLLKRLQ